MNENISEKSFIDGIETNYFQVSNSIFDLEFIVEATKRNIEKDYYGKHKHKYTSHINTRNLSNNEKLVFMYICRCANNGKSAFPSYSVIASRCSMSKETARLAIEVLYNNKFILKKNRGYITANEGQVTKNFSNVYKINNDLKSLAYIDKSKSKVI